MSDHYDDYYEEARDQAENDYTFDQFLRDNYNDSDYMDDKSALGIVCGQLGKNQNNKQAVIAMASSFVNKRAVSGRFDRLFIDECHRVVFKKEGNIGIYQKIITSLMRINPELKIAGVTGTPYRLDQGELHDESHKTKPFFTHKVFDTSIDPGLKALIDNGYLSHIETLNTGVKVDLNGVKLSGFDFNKAQSGVKFDAIIDDAVEDMRNLFDENGIQTALIFTSNIANAQHILSSWGKPSTMRIVCGDESVCTKSQRKSALEWLKNGTGLRIVVNVDILTEGFDYKALDCVVLLRATTSPGLLIQMVGRVIRPHDDKHKGYLIDYGTNIERLTNGGIENIIVPTVKQKRGDALKKFCTAVNDGILCNHPNPPAAKKCSQCKAEFISLNENGLYTMRTVADALTEKVEKEKLLLEVDRVTFEHYQKNDTPMIKMFFWRGDYELLHTEYLCIEHTGSAHGLAIAKIKSLMQSPGRDWYQIGKFEGGHTVKNLLFLFNNYYDHYFKTVKNITLTRDGRFNRLLEWTF